MNSSQGNAAHQALGDKRSPRAPQFRAAEVETVAQKEEDPTVFPSSKAQNPRRQDEKVTLWGCYGECLSPRCLPSPDVVTWHIKLVTACMAKETACHWSSQINIAHVPFVTTSASG